MDFAPRSCPNHHVPNGCTCLPLQEHQHQQRQLHHPPAALPPHSLTSATTVVHFPASQIATNSFNASNDYHDCSRFHDTHGANYGNAVYSQPYVPYDPSSRSHLCLPSPQLPSQHLQVQFASPAEKDVVESVAASNSGRKRKSSSAKNTHSRKRPRVPVVPTTEPPSLICGVGPPTIVENQSPPSTPVRSSSTAHSVSASFQLPKHKQRPTENSAAATDVWYFCRPQSSPTKPVERPAPDQDQLLTRRPKSKYITCKLCS